MLYPTYEAQADLMLPMRSAAGLLRPWLGDTTHSAATLEVLRLAEVTHRRPAWGIDEVTVDGMPRPVVEQELLRTPFCTLRRFRKPGAAPQPRVLLVAPMSGHFATLLRDTVRTMLADHDVHITDWHNARDVPLAAGRFGLDDYTELLMQFVAALGPGTHVVAICQPCVAALAAAALMAEDETAAPPASLTLMAGPIDCRVAPTEVNRLATSKTIEGFERTLIDVVPWRHTGAGRRVYAGFVQLSAFMGMNRQRHVDAFGDYWLHLVAGDADKAAPIRRFYEEYLAVADLPAEFYLETVELVFQRYALPLGELQVGDRRVDPAAVRRTVLLPVEGERADFCAVGQTLAAHDLCTSLRPTAHTHYVQPGVGHYGVFSGKRWQQQIYPLVRDVIHQADAAWQ